MAVPIEVEAMIELHQIEFKIDNLILKMPSGERRNILTELNIMVRVTLEKMKEANPISLLTELENESHDNSI